MTNEAAILDTLVAIQSSVSSVEDLCFRTLVAALWAVGVLLVVVVAEAWPKG